MIINFCMASDAIIKHLNIFKRHTFSFVSGFEFVMMWFNKMEVLSIFWDNNKTFCDYRGGIFHYKVYTLQKIGRQIKEIPEDHHHPLMPWTGIHPHHLCRQHASRAINYLGTCHDNITRNAIQS